MGFAIFSGLNDSPVKANRCLMKSTLEPFLPISIQICFPESFKLTGKDMVAARLPGQLHVPTTRDIHFDADLCKPDYFFLALLILLCNWFDP